eukprot:366357-Chlamydomonas_euryale.AAC.2
MNWQQTHRITVQEAPHTVQEAHTQCRRHRITVQEAQNHSAGGTTHSAGGTTHSAGVTESQCRRRRITVQEAPHTVQEAQNHSAGGTTHSAGGTTHSAGDTRDGMSGALGMHVVVVLVGVQLRMGAGCKGGLQRHLVCSSRVLSTHNPALLLLHHVSIHDPFYLFPPSHPPPHTMASRAPSLHTSTIHALPHKIIHLPAATENHPSAVARISKATRDTLQGRSS